MEIPSGSKIIYSGVKPEIADKCTVVATGKDAVKQAKEDGVVITSYHWDGFRDGQPVGGEVCIVEEDTTESD